MNNILIYVSLFFVGCSPKIVSDSNSVTEKEINVKMINQVSDSINQEYKNYTEDDWKAKLSDDQYYILREKGTERAFSGKYNNNKKEGIYVCAGCSTPLFSSSHKFDSGTGWPSFFNEIDANVLENADNSHGMSRVEIVCSTCKGHLGHVFNDGPKPTGLRYCVNSVSLNFNIKE